MSDAGDAGLAASRRRLAVALAIFAVLIALAARTLTDPRLRLITLVVLGFFAARTYFAWRRQRAGE